MNSDDINELYSYCWAGLCMCSGLCFIIYKIIFEDILPSGFMVFLILSVCAVTGWNFPLVKLHEIE